MPRQRMEPEHARGVVVKAVLFQSRMTMPFEMLREPRIDVHIDHMCRHMVIELGKNIMAQELEEQVVQYPDGWWEACKERWFPLWYKRRYPVRLVRVKLTADAVLPQLSEDLCADYGPPIIKIKKRTLWEGE